MKSLFERFSGPRDRKDGAAEEELAACLNCNTNLADAPEYSEFRVCPACGFHSSIDAQKRIDLLFDTGSFREMHRGLSSIDPLAFGGQDSYRSRIFDEQRRTGLIDAVLTGTATIHGERVVLGVLDFRFLGGSIGCAVGERVSLALEYATRRKLPVVMVVSSGGIRIQEGLLSLVQVSKMVAAAERHSAAGLPLISVLANPTIGAAYAGFVSLSDVILAEPGAIVGYATTRALEESSGGQIHAGSHTAEFQLEHGLIDSIIARAPQRDYLAALLAMVTSSYRLTTSKRTARVQIPAGPGAWNQVQIARHGERPTAREYIERMTTTFVELRGDRAEGDDTAVVCGIGQLGGESVVLVGHERHQGRTVGIRPEGFRKARRAMLLANKLRLPLISLVDTAGVAIDIAAERHGLGAAIAGCVATASALSAPSVSVIIGEGGGEAALAFSVANRLLMMEHAVFTATSPEVAASVLYRDAGQADIAAAALRLTAADCRNLHIVDGIIMEPPGGAHAGHQAASRALKDAILRELVDVQGMSARRLAEGRYDRLRKLGRYNNRFADRARQEAGRVRASLRGVVGHLGSVASRPGRGGPGSGAQQLLFPKSNP
jgi:acetyl-CoA carboxylase carboxyl transferase subunit beta